MMTSVDWSFGVLVCVVIAGCAVSYWIGRHDRRVLLAQELAEAKSENALLQYERGEIVKKLEELRQRCAQSESENRILRARIVALEDLAAVHGVNASVIRKCDEALAKLRGKASGE